MARLDRNLKHSTGSPHSDARSLQACDVGWTGWCCFPPRSIGLEMARFMPMWIYPPSAEG